MAITGCSTCGGDYATEQAVEIASLTREASVQQASADAYRLAESERVSISAPDFVGNIVDLYA